MQIAPQQQMELSTIYSRFEFYEVTLLEGSRRNSINCVFSFSV